jgi:hypothetical protein
MDSLLFRLRPAFGALFFCLLILASDRCHASPTLPELEKRAVEIRSQLENLEKELQLLRGTTTSASIVAAPATAQRPANWTQSPRSDLADSVRPGPEASNRFLEWLIVLAFLGASASFIVGRYRDSQLDRGNEEHVPEGQKSQVSSPESAVVFFTRESRENPETKPPAESGNVADDITGTAAPESEPAPTVDRPDLLVEPKKSPRSRKNS